MNSRSSNETEVIDNSEYLPTNIWHKFFFAAQGYKMKYNYFSRTMKEQKRWPKMDAYCVGTILDTLTSNSFGLQIELNKGKLKY